MDEVDKVDMERRTIRLRDVELRKAEETDGHTPEIRGYAAVFGSLSEDLGGFREQIAPGAFATSIRQNDIRALWEHNPQYVLGRNTSGTLNLDEDEQGLWITVVPPDAQWARDLMAMMERGDVNQMSFGFQTREDSWENTPTGPVRTLKDVSLFDVSVVSFPAYAATSAQVRDYLTALSQADGADDAAKAGLQARSAARRRNIRLMEM